MTARLRMYGGPSITTGTTVEVAVCLVCLVVIVRSQKPVLPKFSSMSLVCSRSSTQTHTEGSIARLHLPPQANDFFFPPRRVYSYFEQDFSPHSRWHCAATCGISTSAPVYLFCPVRARHRPLLLQCPWTCPCWRRATAAAVGARDEGIIGEWTFQTAGG